jgi:hypothetical protein
MHSFKLIAIAVALALTGGAAIAGASHAGPSHMPLSIPAPHGVVPAAMHHAGERAEAAYHAAIDAPEVLASVPCTCGCETLGHQNNLDCYIDDVYSDGTINYSTHGLYCTICQEITRDAVAGADAGMSPSALHDMIVAKYGAHR